MFIDVVGLGHKPCLAHVILLIHSTIMKRSSDVWKQVAKLASPRFAHLLHLLSDSFTDRPPDGVTHLLFSLTFLLQKGKLHIQNPIQMWSDKTSCLFVDGFSWRSMIFFFFNYGQMLLLLNQVYWFFGVSMITTLYGLSLTLTNVCVRVFIYIYMFSIATFQKAQYNKRQGYEAPQWFSNHWLSDTQLKAADSSTSHKHVWFFIVTVHKGNVTLFKLQSTNCSPGKTWNFSDFCTSPWLFVPIPVPSVDALSHYWVRRLWSRCMSLSLWVPGPITMQKIL